MLFRKQYSFEINQNKKVLSESLKNLKGKDQSYRNGIGSESSYSIEFNWDEFVVTRKAEMFERSAGIEPDAHIQLVQLSEKLTRIDVKIKFSEIVWIILVFIHLGIIGGSLFLPQIKLFGNQLETTWINRILFLILSLGVINSIIWLLFISEVKTLRNVVQQIFEGLIFLSHDETLTH
jgi:hypothetical protein